MPFEWFAFLRPPETNKFRTTTWQQLILEFLKSGIVYSTVILATELAQDELAPSKEMKPCLLDIG